MKKQDAMDFFADEKGNGGYLNMTRVLRLSSGTVSLWGDVVPRAMAFELEVLTDGALKVDLSCYKQLKRDRPEVHKEIKAITKAKRKAA